MTQNHTVVIPSLASDEALALAEEAERLQGEINALHAQYPQDHRKIAQANARMGICLKLAEVHANLAIAEQIRALREDLADVPVPYVPSDRPTVVKFDGRGL